MDSKIHQSFFIPSVLGEIAMRIRGRKAITSININSAVPKVPNILTSLYLSWLLAGFEPAVSPLRLFATKPLSLDSVSVFARTPQEPTHSIQKPPVVYFHKLNRVRHLCFVICLRSLKFLAGTPAKQYY